MGAVGRITRAQFEKLKKGFHLSDEQWEKSGVTIDGDTVTIRVPDGYVDDGLTFDSFVPTTESAIDSLTTESTIDSLTTESPVDSIPAAEILAETTESALWVYGTYLLWLILLVIVGKMKMVSCSLILMYTV